MKSQTGRARWICGNKVLSQLLILLGVFLTCIAPNVADCPPLCQCKWVNAKNTAFCIAANYTFIPFINSNIQVLNMTGNNIEILGENAFNSTEYMIDLQKISLKSVNLTKIHRYTFTDLKNMVELDLSNNLLSEIPLGTFSENKRLRILNLSGNPLKVLPNEQFPEMPHLRRLELENCQLHTIEPEAFLHLPSLTYLNLESNQLQYLHREIFQPFFNLTTLLLHNNPWNCDCNLRDFRSWYLARKLNSISLYCVKPENLREKLWENLLYLDFSCHPESSITDEYITYRDLGDNITLHCKVSGDPEPEVAWIFKGQELDSNFSADGRYLLDANRETPRVKWSNLTLFDLEDEDSGEYTCRAKNFMGISTANVSILLTENRIDRSFKRSNNYWFIFTGFVLAGLIIFILFVTVVACGCMTYNRNLRRKHMRKAKIRSSKNSYDQEKQLLDMSLSNTDQMSRKSSCENLDSRDSMELLKHSSLHSIDTYGTRRPFKEATAVIPLSATFQNQPIYPPPPEFSNLPQSNTLGNIYISVSLTDDPNVTIKRYPDLLNHKSSTNLSEVKPSTSEGNSMAFATLPRRQLKLERRHPQPPKSPKYDNMGKRITVGGSTTLSTFSLNRDRDKIPTPPPPPMSTRPDFDYIPL